jgi:hypothetical protein
VKTTKRQKRDLPDPKGTFRVRIRDKQGTKVPEVDNEGSAMPLSRIKPRSDSALVRNMLGEIEAALTAGASREDVWETLKNEHGMTIGFNGFCKALMRARAARQERAGTPAATRPVNNGQGKEVDCAIQNDEPTPPEAPLKGRIVTSSDFEKVHSMDFSDLDDKYTGKRK